MKQLASDTNIDQNVLCAKLIMDTLPAVINTMVGIFRSQRTTDLSVPQFRVLMYLNKHEGSSLSDIAEHMGVTLPTLSKMVDGLIRKGYLCRATSVYDRRKMVLFLKEPGVQVMHHVRTAAEKQIALLVSPLSSKNQQDIMQVMELFQELFAARAVVDKVSKE